MRKLFICFLAAGLFALSCNNKGKSDTGNSKGIEKDDYLNGKKGSDDDNSDEKGGGEWSASDVRKFNAECKGSLEKEGIEEEMVSKICDCWIGKAQAKYASFSEADKDHSGAHETMVKDCATEVAGGGNTNVNDNTNSGGWTEQEETKFLTDCRRTATAKAGSAVASRYCNCMLEKIKGMYSSYAEADRELSRLSQDEINQLAADCGQ